MRHFLILALLPLAACQSNSERESRSVNASGVGATRAYDATGFTRVSLRGPDDVDVRHGDGFSVRAEGDSRVLDHLEIRVVDGELRIGRDDENNWLWGGGNRGSARIQVTLPRLTAASIGGSGNMTVDRAEGAFEGDIAGSGNLTVAALNAEATRLSIAGSGNLQVAGTATRLDASVAGSGDIEARGLTASSASISIAGSGDVRGTVNGEAQVSIVGSGDVELVGGARCQVSRVGSGDARCG